MKNDKIDLSCVPYPRKGLYWLITLPYLIVLVTTMLYLWSIRSNIALVYFGLYILSTLLHGYVCSFSECPYKGTSCPGAFGWFGVGLMAGLFSSMKIRKSQNLINLFFLLVMISLLGIVLIPLFWLYKAKWIFSVAYFLFMLIHFFSFILKALALG